MEKVLKLYRDDLVFPEFPNSDYQAILTTFEYNADRMGCAPTITGKLKYPTCLDNEWSNDVYVQFNGEKYYVLSTPSSSKTNEDFMYEHEVTFLSEREKLNHVYFIDAVTGNRPEDGYKSNSTKVIFTGDIYEFVSRLNSAMDYAFGDLGYTVYVDSGISTEPKLVSFEDKYIGEALQEIYNIYGIPYYFVGKTIRVGYTDNAIPYEMKYGINDALLSISRQNANYQTINRVTGTGSTDNIPYYYPNDMPDRDAVIASGAKWITPSKNLMPPIYRETQGLTRFYDAKNNTYTNDTGEFYVFENEYTQSNPQEGITTFDDIKPSIEGVTNGQGQRIDSFIEFAYDENDNDEIDEDGNYVHPYFFAKLRKTDGTYGFNLFDQAIENQTMQIYMTSGICGACTFEVGVGENSQQNTVQVDETGNLLRDDDGDVRCGREGKPGETPQEVQNDTSKYYVWIALKKDDTTYPQIMPNKNYNYRPSAGDTFVILGINMPKSYVTAAEQRLEKALIQYMWENNREKFTFSLKFSRIFFEEHPEILAQLNENARLNIKYNDTNVSMYVSSFTYKVEDSTPLPEISVELTETLTIGKNSLQNAIDGIRNDILSSIGNVDYLRNGFRYFLRKDINDTASGQISFKRGIDVAETVKSNAVETHDIKADTVTAVDNVTTPEVNATNEEGTGVVNADKVNSPHINAVGVSNSGLVETDTARTVNIETTRGTAQTFDVEDRLTANIANIKERVGSETFASGIVGGQGWRIGKYGDAEMESLILRRFLEVPELRYNRVEVSAGDKWRAPGAGLIESVNTANKTCTLKLEEGEIGAVAVGDICMGIYHSTKTSENATADKDDSRGNRQFAGFATVYFTITEVSGDNNSQFKYQLRPESERWPHSFEPYEFMTFVSYGNFNREDRQQSVYETKTYTRMLVHQNTWEMGVQNIAMQYGDLSNLSVHELDMEGYSMYLNNVYFTGLIKQMKPDGTPVMTANDRGAWVSGTTYDYYDRVSHNGCIWLCINEDGSITEPSKDNPDWLLQVDKGEDGTSGESPVIVEISSQNGVFMGGTVRQTVLTATVKNGNTDITETLPDSAFSWEKKSLDTTSDSAFNASHQGVGNSITITGDEVSASAEFSCIVNIEV